MENKIARRAHYLVHKIDEVEKQKNEFICATENPSTTKLTIRPSGMVQFKVFELECDEVATKALKDFILDRYDKEISSLENELNDL